MNSIHKREKERLIEVLAIRLIRVQGLTERNVLLGYAEMVFLYRDINFQKKITGCLVKNSK